MQTRELLVVIAWGTFLAVWIVGAMNTARTVKRSVGWDRLAIALLALAAIFALRVGGQSWLVDARFAPDDTATLVLGVVMLYGGLALAIWARVHLGRYWSGMVTLKEGHKLIRTGPYAYVRNPIYSGILLGFLGAAVLLGRWFLLVAALVMLLTFLAKIRREEALLAEAFGEEFAAYKREVKSLVPGIW